MWDKTVLDEYNRRYNNALVGGGIERVKRQRALGKLTARERLNLLFDAGSFQETGMLVETRAIDFDMQSKKYPGDGVVTGYGLIGGRTVFAAAQDSTVFGGAGGEEYLLKMCRALEMAIEARAPFVCLCDSGGARIEEGICSLSAYSRLFYLNTRASGVIPQIAVIMGNCAGGASYSPVLCDFVFMVKGVGNMYITGPKVIQSVTGEVVSMEELGGAHIHSEVSGQAHFTYDDDQSCIEGVKALLRYLPQSWLEKPPRDEPEPKSDESERLSDIVPDDKRRAYDVHEVIRAIADDGGFFEVLRDFARNIVIGFGHMDGQCVGFVANQPKHLSGALDCDAADKASRFIRFCDCFNIPLVVLVDVPAFYPGIRQERKGILRHGSKLLFAFSEATVPKITLIMRKAYGGAYCAMNSKALGADMVFAWPIAEIAVMGAEGAVNVIHRKKIMGAPNPEQERKRLISEYEEVFLNPYYAAQKGMVDEVILPEATKSKIVRALNALQFKQLRGSKKKHGNMPL